MLYERNATKAFRPASTLKLVTTAAALDAFGPDARVRTTLETAGRLDGRGRLLGDVYLVGRGDASLSGRFHDGHATAPFEEMADALAAAGVHRIEGRLVGHEGAFSGDRQGLDWMREDLDWGYGAAVSALSFADNALSVTLGPGEQPGGPGGAHRGAVQSPVPGGVPVLTGGAGEEEDVTLRRVTGPGPVVAVLSGVVPRSSGGEWEGEVAVEDPALFAVTVLSEVLQSRGVSVAGGVGTTSEPLPSGLRVVAAHEGAPLRRLVEEVNKESQNLHAELLLRRLGAHANGPGTTEAGLDAVTEFLDRLSVPRSGWGLKDGSGLSHTNLVTPRGLVALLVAMDRHPERRRVPRLTAGGGQGRQPGAAVAGHAGRGATRGQARDAARRQRPRRSRHNLRRGSPCVCGHREQPRPSLRRRARGDRRRRSRPRDRPLKRLLASMVAPGSGANERFRHGSFVFQTTGSGFRSSEILRFETKT